MRQNCGQINHSNIYMGIHVVVITYLRMNFTKIADLFSVIHDLRLPAGMQERLVCLRVIFHLIQHADAVKELFNHALHAVEIAFAVESQRQLHSFIRKFRQRKFLCNIYISHLIQTDILVSSVIVC